MYCFKLNPYNDREVLIDNNCLLRLQVSFNSVYIEHIRSLPEFKNKGYASKLLKRLVDLADKMNVRLTLHPQPTDNQGQGLSMDDLINWYKNHLLITNFLENRNIPYIWNGSFLMDNEYSDKYRFDGDYGDFREFSIDGKHATPKHNEEYSKRLLQFIKSNFPDYLPK